MGGATSTNRSGGDGAFDKVRRVSTALRGIHSQPQPKRKLLIIFLESRQPQPLRSLLIIFLLSTSPSTFFVLPSYRMRSSARRTRWRPCTRSSRPTSRPGRHRLPLLSRRAATTSSLRALRRRRHWLATDLEGTPARAIAVAAMTAAETTTWEGSTTTTTTTI